MDRLRRGVDEGAWRRFVELYTPLLFHWARRCGESEADAADLVQEVFVALLGAIPTLRHDASGGKLRGWLRTAMLNKLRDRKRRDARFDRAAQALANESNVPDPAEAFSEMDFQKELARRSLALMQAEFAPTTWKACWETVVRGRDAAEVAGELGLSENAVYIARCRVLRRLREEFAGLVEPTEIS